MILVAKLGHQSHSFSQRYVPLCRVKSLKTSDRIMTLHFRILRTKVNGFIGVDDGIPTLILVITGNSLST